MIYVSFFQCWGIWATRNVHFSQGQPHNYQHSFFSASDAPQVTHFELHLKISHSVKELLWSAAIHGVTAIFHACPTFFSTRTFQIPAETYFFWPGFILVLNFRATIYGFVGILLLKDSFPPCHPKNDLYHEHWPVFPLPLYFLLFSVRLHLRSESHRLLKLRWRHRSHSLPGPPGHSWPCFYRSFLWRIKFYGRISIYLFFSSFYPPLTHHLQHSHSSPFYSHIVTECSKNISSRFSLIFL